jgi:hypothetical protein
VEAQWNNIKKCALDTTSDLVGKAERIARKPWITKQMISKTEERMKRKNVNNEEGRNNHTGLKNQLNRATGKAKNEYLSIRENHGISKHRTLLFNVSKVKGTVLETQSWNSKHRY